MDPDLRCHLEKAEVGGKVQTELFLGKSEMRGKWGEDWPVGTGVTEEGGWMDGQTEGKKEMGGRQGPFKSVSCAQEVLLGLQLRTSLSEPKVRRYCCRALTVCPS